MRAKEFLGESGSKYTVYNTDTKKVIKPNITKAAAEKLVATNKDYKYGSPAWVHDKLNEGDVVKGQFGSGGGEVPGMPIPKGYASFSTKQISDKGATQIIGVTADGKSKVLSTVTSPEGAEAMASYYNSGSSTSIKPMSMAKAFGSEEYNIIADAGFKFIEKPSYFSDLERRAISVLDLQKIKNALKAEGYKLKIYSDEWIFGIALDEEHDGPQHSVVQKPKENVFLISMELTGNMYLVDQQGASKYIRFWMGIDL